MDSAVVTTSPGNPTGDGFITVTKQKRSDGAVKSSENNKIGSKFRTPVYGVRSSSSLAVVSKRVKTKALFHASPRDDENSLKGQLKLSSIVQNSKPNLLHTPHFTFLLRKMTFIHNTGMWHDGCLIAPFYGRLSPDQIFNSESYVTSRPQSPGATWLPLHLALLHLLMRPMGGGGGPYATYLMVKYCNGNVRDFSMSDTQSQGTFEIFYHNVRCLRTKQIEVFDNVCSMDCQIICLTETWLNDRFSITNYFQILSLPTVLMTSVVLKLGMVVF
jgi:hypothetical protein